jgi:WD40 repeat protein
VPFFPSGEVRPAEGLPPPPVHRYRAADDLVLDRAAVALGGQVAAWVGRDCALYILEPGTGRRVRLLAGSVAEEPTCLALSPDGRLLAASLGDATVRVWDVAAAAEWGRLPAARGRVVSASFSPDGRLLFTCTRDAEVTVWDLGGPWPPRTPR